MESDRTTFSQLPAEAKLGIFSFLSLRDRGRYCSVSKEWAALLSDDYLWRSAVRQIRAEIEFLLLSEQIDVPMTIPQKSQYKELHMVALSYHQPHLYRQKIDQQWDRMRSWGCTMVEFEQTRQILFGILLYAVAPLIWSWVFLFFALFIAAGHHNISWAVPIGCLAALFLTVAILETVHLMACRSARSAMIAFQKQFHMNPPGTVTSVQDIYTFPVFIIGTCLLFAAFFALLAAKIGGTLDLDWWMVWLPLWLLHGGHAIFFTAYFYRKNKLNWFFMIATLTTVVVVVFMLSSHLLIYLHLMNHPGLDTWPKALSMMYVLYSSVTLYVMCSGRSNFCSLVIYCLCLCFCFCLNRPDWRRFRRYSVRSSLRVIAPVLGAVFLILLSVKLSIGKLTWAAVFAPLIGMLGSLTYVVVVLLITGLGKSPPSKYASLLHRERSC